MNVVVTRVDMYLLLLWLLWRVCSNVFKRLNFEYVVDLGERTDLIKDMISLHSHKLEVVLRRSDTRDRVSSLGTLVTQL